VSYGQSLKFPVDRGHVVDCWYTNTRSEDDVPCYKHNRLCCCTCISIVIFTDGSFVCT